MGEAVQSQIANPGQIGTARKSQIAKWLRGLYAAWREFSREHSGLAGLSERDWRLYWTNGRLAAHKQRAVGSWKELTEGQARYLLKLLHQDSGTNAGYALRYVMWLAPQIYGPEWDQLLHARLEGQPYFFYGPVDQLDGRRRRGLIEEMLDALGRQRREQGIGNREQMSGAELRAAKEAVRTEMIAAVRGRQHRPAVLRSATVIEGVNDAVQQLP